MASKKKFTIPAANGPAALLGTYATLPHREENEEAEDQRSTLVESSRLPHTPSVLDVPAEDFMPVPTRGGAPTVQPVTQHVAVFEEKETHQDLEDEPEDTIRFSVWMPRSLNEGIEDKIYEMRKKGVRLKKAHIIRDYMSIFAYGIDAVCPEGHRFLLPSVPESREVICPICGRKAII